MSEETDKERIAEIRARHEELVIMYGGEPWDESCVEDGEKAHMDREFLLSLISQLERKEILLDEILKRVPAEALI